MIWPMDTVLITGITIYFRSLGIDKILSIVVQGGIAISKKFHA